MSENNGELPLKHPDKETVDKKQLLTATDDTKKDLFDLLNGKLDGNGRFKAPDGILYIITRYDGRVLRAPA